MSRAVFSRPAVGIRKSWPIVAGLKAKGFVRDGVVHWLLEGNELEFTVSEFREMMDEFAEDGLFDYLGRARPALLSRLRGLFPDSLATPEDEKELEYLLEQCLLGLERKVSLK